MKNKSKKKKKKSTNNSTLVPTQLGAGTKKYQSTVYIDTAESFLKWEQLYDGGDMTAAALSNLFRDKILMWKKHLLPQDAPVMVWVYITHAH